MLFVPVISGSLFIRLFIMDKGPNSSFYKTTDMFRAGELFLGSQRATTEHKIPDRWSEKMTCVLLSYRI